MSVELVLLPPAALDALLARDLAGASAAAGLELPREYLDDERLWKLRVDQIAEDAASAPWLVRAVVAGGGTVVGHAGFHAPPGEDGRAEVGYWILPAHRRRGHARAALRELIAYARDHGARVVRAAVAPDNEPSLALLRSEGFAEVGEQWDEEDGRELVLERPF